MILVSLTLTYSSDKPDGVLLPAEDQDTQEWEHKGDEGQAYHEYDATGSQGQFKGFNWLKVVLLHDRRGRAYSLYVDFPGQYQIVPALGHRGLW